MKAKIMIIIMILFLSVSLAFAGGDVEQSNDTADVRFNRTGFPIVDEKITLNFVAKSAPLAPPYNEMTLFQRLEEETGVHINWDNIPDNIYDEKINLLLAAKNLPDAFFNTGLSELDISKYGDQGLFVPLEGLIDEYMPNLTDRIFSVRPGYRKGITAPDGHIYSLPEVEEMAITTPDGTVIPIGAVPYFYAINKNWIDKLNMEVPDTIEELHDVLLAFKNEDPNGNGKADEIALSFMHMGWCMDIGDLFAVFGLPDNLDHRIVRNGEVIFTAMQEEYRQALAYYHTWVEEGIIDVESFSQDPPQYLSKGKNPDYILGSFVWWEIPEVVGTDRADDYILLPPVKGFTGERIVGRSNFGVYGKTAFSITKDNQYPEITARWVDNLFEPYTAAQLRWGPIGEIYEKTAEGKLVNLPLPEGVTMGELRQKVAPGGGSPSIVLAEDFGTIVDMEPRAVERLENIVDVYSPFLVSENYPQVTFTVEELQVIDELLGDVMELTNEKRAGWLMNGFSDKDWEKYLKVLNSIGINELISVYQSALDRYNNY